MEDDVELNFNFDLGDLAQLGDLVDNEDDDDIEIVDDEELPMSGDEEPLMSGDEDVDDMSMTSDEEEDMEDLPMAESKKMPAKRKKVVSENKQVAALKAELAKERLWTAKILYANKFLQREDLSKQQKQKIVEYLDKAKTLNEAKTIYSRVKSLTENSKKKVTASAAQVATSGAPAQEVKTPETANIFENAQLVSEDRNRLMELAGIKKRS
jgi:hypothetical protein